MCVSTAQPNAFLRDLQLPCTNAIQFYTHSRVDEYVFLGPASAFLTRAERVVARWVSWLARLLARKVARQRAAGGQDGSVVAVDVHLDDGDDGNDVDHHRADEDGDRAPVDDKDGSDPGGGHKHPLHRCRKEDRAGGKDDQPDDHDDHDDVLGGDATDPLLLLRTLLPFLATSSTLSKASRQWHWLCEHPSSRRVLLLEEHPSSSFTCQLTSLVAKRVAGESTFQELVRAAVAADRATSHSNNDRATSHSNNDRATATATTSTTTAMTTAAAAIVAATAADSVNTPAACQRMRRALASVVEAENGGYCYSRAEQHFIAESVTDLQRIEAAAAVQVVNSAMVACLAACVGGPAQAAGALGMAVSFGEEVARCKAKLRAGDVVTCIDDAELAEQLVRPRFGWNPLMSKALGKRGTVVGEVRVFVSARVCPCACVWCVRARVRACARACVRCV
jgi:hypothetical protein